MRTRPVAASGQLAQELGRLRPFWQAAQARFGRTTVGVSLQSPEEWPAYAAAALGGTLGVVAPHTAGEWALRFWSDDVKAMYSEAAQSSEPPPASRQIDLWFWRETIAGQVLMALRRMALAGDGALKTIGTRFLVPAVFLPGDTG